MSSRRHGRGGGHEEEASAERWLLTYADMITLLLALFIVLFAVSTINQKKFLAFELGLTQTFNPNAANLPGGNGLLNQASLISRPGTNPSPTPVLTGTTTQTPTKAQQETAIDVKDALAKAGVAGDAKVTVTEQGVVVEVLSDDVFFGSDSASLGTVGDRVIDAVAGVVAPMPNNVEVEGFTDNVPITGGPYSSNWELSAARAADVVNRMNTVDDVPQDRLSALGFGDTHPEVSNSTAANRSKNRRIDIVILNA